ncbi:MAG: hypothetical protein AAFN92_21360, partial [Bacteroidota bacterium]
MRYSFLFLLTFLLFTACGNDQAPADEVAAPQPFAPAAEALTAGKSAAEVGGMLLQAFPAVSDPTTGMVDPIAGKDYVKA